jgi:ribose 5-phosphate isomerase A
MSSKPIVPRLAAERAVEWVQPGAVVGLGTGRAACAFLTALADRMHASGLKIRGVPTSQSTAELAESLGIPLLKLDEVDAIDVTVDGADEVGPDLTVIKGLGGALLREKVVASLSRTWVLIVGRDKVVARLGERRILPVEVVPFASSVCMRQIEKLGHRSTLRSTDGRTYVTDNGNSILDCSIEPGDDVITLATRIRALPGVVETGLFVAMHPTVVVQDENHVEVLGGGT